MELQPRSRRPSDTDSTDAYREATPDAEDGYGQRLGRNADEKIQGPGNKGTRCLLGLNVLLPGQSQLQPIELCFDAAWPSTTAPVSVHFDGSGQVAIHSPRAAAWEDGNLLALQFEPVHVENLQTTGPEAPAVPNVTDSLGRLRQAAAMLAALFFGAVLAVLYISCANAISSYSENSEQQNRTIWIHEAVNDAASRYAGIVVLLTAPVTHFNHSTIYPFPAEAINGIEATMDELCGYTAKVPRRPDLADLCVKHRNATINARACMILFDFPDPTSWNIGGRLFLVSTELYVADLLRGEYGETQATEDDDEDDITRWVRRRHQDGKLAGTLLNNSLPEWNRRYASAQRHMHKAERSLRDITGWAENIADGFEHELERGRFNEWEAPKIRREIDELRSLNIPFAAFLLNLTVAANAILDPAVAQLAGLTAALAVMSDEYHYWGHPDFYQADVSPWLLQACFLIHRMEVWWGFTQQLELGDINWSRIQMDKMVHVLRDRIDEADTNVDAIQAEAQALALAHRDRRREAVPQMGQAE